MMTNIFQNVPSDLPNEVFEDLVSTDHVRIERIISKGHCSEQDHWYDQSEHEWVMVLQGQGVIGLENGTRIELNPGDYFNLKAHQKHQVLSTSENEITIWLAVFYR